MHVLKNKIKKSYLWGALIVLCFLSFSFFSLNQLISHQKNDGLLINIAGKQRMFLQKITLHTHSYLAHLGTNKESEQKRLLISLAQSMYDDHLFLLNYNDDLSAKVRKMYFVSEELLHEKIKLFTNNAIEVANLSNKQKVIDFIDEKFSSEHLEQLLIDTNLIVEEMEFYSANNLSKIERRIFLLWVFIVISLSVIVVFSFRHINILPVQRLVEFDNDSEKETDFEFAISQHSIVYRLTLELNLTYVNDKFCDFFSLNKKSVLNRNYRELALHDDFLSIVEHGIETKLPNQYELVYDINGEEKWLDTTIVPIKSHNITTSYMVIQNEITEQRMMNVALKSVYQTVTDNLDLSEQIYKILRAGCDFLKLSNGIVSEIHEQNYTVKYAMSPKGKMKEGDTLAINKTYCTQAILSDAPVSFHHVKYSQINEHLCYKTYGLESYIGCTFYVDNKVYGTLSFSCMSPRHKEFTKHQIDFISLLSKWLGIAISQEKQKEKLSTQQHLMEKMSEQARIGAWEYDLLTGEVTWSKMTRKILEVEDDYKPDVESVIAFYKGEENQQTIKRLLEEVLLGGKAFQVEMELETAKGNSAWVCSHVEAIFKDCACVKIYGSFQDITAKHDTDITIADNNRRMKLATDSSSIGIWEYNIITHEIVWDELMFRLYGVRKKDFDKNKTTLIQYIHPEDADRISYELQLAINDKKKFNTQFRIITPNNIERHIKASAIVLRDFNGVPQTIIGVNYDVTESILNEVALIKAKEQAEQASTIKDDFLASMSHEIRTPLNGVLGMLDLISDSELDKEQRQQIAIVQSSASFLLHLINDILDFSKINANQLQIESITFDLRLLIEELVISMAPQVKDKKLEIMLDTVELVDTHVIGDPNRIRQILINLLGNAIKFTMSGDIIVKAALKTEGENWRLLLSVQDTGIGISAEKHETIFDNFAQVDSSTTRNFGGTGLGLAIVKRLCEYMNGHIELISEEHKGSNFTCNIELKKVNQTQSKLSPSYFKKLSILIISNHLASRAIISNQCEQWKVNVNTVDTLEQAIEQFELTNKQNSYDVKYDLIIVDTNVLNDFNRQKFISFNQDQRFKSIAWVILTSESQKQAKKQLQEVDYISFLSKPMTYEDFYSILCSVANRDENNKQQLKIEKLRIKRDENKKLLTSKGSWPIGIRILLVEDNKVNQMVMSGLLTKLSLNCELAITGEEALKMLNSDVHYDMVFMDCQMPEMDGYQATKKIRNGGIGKHRSHIPIIAMTANAMPHDKGKCLEAGMSDYLSKPINTNQLVEVIDKWLVIR